MKQNKNKPKKQSSIVRSIVTLTVFLDALFLVIILSFSALFYYWNVNQYQTDSANFQTMIFKERINEIFSDISSDVNRLAQDPVVVDYLNYINADNTPIVTDDTDPNYDIYRNFMDQLASISEYQEDGLFNIVYVASSANCSNGTDGCAISQNGDLSASDWALTQRPWYAEAQSKDVVLTEPYTDSLTSEPVITYIQKVYDGFTPIGYVGVDVLLSTLSTVINANVSETIPDESTVLLFSNISNNPTMVYSSNETLSAYLLVDSTNYSTLDNGLGYANNGIDFIVSSYSSDSSIQSRVLGNRYTIVYSDISGYNYTVVSLSDIATPIPIEIMFLIILGLSGLFIFGIGFIMFRSVKKSLNPLHDILQTIEEIKNGNLDAKVTVEQDNELREIGNAINMMSSELDRQIKKTYNSLAYDVLTGLKNRASASTEVNEKIFKNHKRAAVCLIQVDNLKNINVTKGQIIGDNLIKAIADELKKAFKNHDTLFFNGGNEFIYIKDDIESLEEVEFSIGRLLTHFKQPLVVKNIKTEVKLHVGISIFPSDGDTLDELIKKCDTALYKASSEGNKKIIFYNEKIARSVSYEAEISEQLSQAINKNQLYLKYQPLITSGSEVYGFEALARWSSPVLGEIGPQVFIANAEESYLIIPIGTWILRQACLAQVEMKKKYDKEYVISVNVSPVQILQKDFVSIVKSIVKETDINPEYLTLEITESLFIEASILLEDTIEELHKIGIKLSLDDFGTGYASLTYLRQIAFDNLKIDKTFIDGIFANAKDHRIVATIVNLVHNLDMRVIAEGVETITQYEYLKEISTDVFQGYIFSKPLLLEDVYNFMERFHKVPKSRRAEVFASLFNREEE